MKEWLQKIRLNSFQAQAQMNKKYQSPESSARLYNLLLIAALSMGAHLELSSTIEILKNTHSN